MSVAGRPPLLLLCFAFADIISACGSRTEPAARDAIATASDATHVDDGIHADTVTSMPCGATVCGAGQICARGRCAGCCNLPPSCVAIPAGCTGSLGCDCFATDPCGPCTHCQSVMSDGVQCGDCQCTCAAPWTPIATPHGTRSIAELREGDLVYSVDHGSVRAVPIARVSRTPAARHTMVRVALANGNVIEISAGHPTADGRTFEVLAPDQWLGYARIVSIETVPYSDPFTYDILPASDTATYFAGGALIGSTLRAR